MANDEWIIEKLQRADIIKENRRLCEQKGLRFFEFAAHIEVYNKHNELLKVVYCQASLNFYLKGVRDEVPKVV